MNPLRALMGGTSRLHHLRLNKCVGLLLFGGALYQPWLGISAIACLATEHFASPDNDLANRGYWGLYGLMVAHRSRFSHSLLLGLPLRLYYRFWFWTALAIALMPTIPEQADTAIQYALGGAIASDVAHYCLDSIPPWRWLVGKL